MTDPVIASPTQNAILRFRNTCSIVSSGTRGSQKTVAMLLDVLDRCREYGEDCRPLVVRESHQGLLQISDQLYLMAHSAFNGDVRRNKAENTLALGNGALIQYTQINDLESYSKQQGKSYCSIYYDEQGNYSLSSIEYCEMLRASLRPPIGIRQHTHRTLNPWGLAHTYVLSTFIKDEAGNTRSFWKPYQINDVWFVNTHTTFRSNEFLDIPAYEREIIASCHGNQNQLDAWLEGRWSMIGGSMFAPPFAYDMHRIPAIPHVNPGAIAWATSVDWGLSSPSAILCGFKVKEPMRGLPKGSIVVAAEDDTCVGERLDVGDGSPPSVVGDMAKALMEKCGAPRGSAVIVDDARGLHASDTVVEHFLRAGLSASKPNKAGGRTRAWVSIRQLLHNAIEQNGQPVLLIHESCAGLLATLPAAPRCKRRVHDVDPGWNLDHHLDALGMLVNHFTGPGVRQGRHVGMY